MALSPSSRNRARVIREMAKDLNRTNHSVVSSTGSNHGSVPDSTLSNFDPENEALMSTRQLDNTSQQLPELRASAKKFSRYTRPEMDFVIDTSALGRAFPDFTGGGGSSDDSVSIEISRGKKAGNKVSYNPNDSALSSRAIIAGNYEVVSTPPMKSRPAPSRLDRQEVNKNNSQAQRNPSSQPGNQGLREKVSKTTNYGSSSSGQSNGRPRRTLAELHARVRDENDESFLIDEPPPTTTFTTKATRFGSGRGNQSSSHARKQTKMTNPDDLYDVSFQQNPNAPTQSHGGTTGQQSFILPDLPNISELVSGVHPDGTPVFSRSARVPSRFSSANPGRSPRGPQNVHLPLESIPVPEEERAIFISLRLLQDKVAGLENEKAGAEKIIDELKAENNNLKAENNHNARHRRSDSALGLADSGSDGGDGMKGSARRAAEKTKLESNLKTVQEKLDAATRKVSVTEINIKNLSRERDALMSQVGVAYCTTEELKTENATLRKENAELRRRLEHISATHDDETQEWAKKEARLRNKAERRADAVKDVREMTREIFELQHSSLPTSKHQKSSSSRGRGQSSSRAAATVPEESRQKSRSRSRHRSEVEIAKNKDRKVVVESYVDSEDGDLSVDETVRSRRSRKSSFNQRSITGAESSFESIFPAIEMAKLRQILADERAKKEAREEAQENDDTFRSGRSLKSVISNSGRALPRKSSMKPVSSTVGNPMALEENDFTGGIRRTTAEQTNHSRTSSTHQRRHSDISISSKSGIRTGKSGTEVTSAFIIPDNTMHGVSAGPGQKPTLSADAQRVLDGIARHDGRNCTVCNRYTSVEKPEAGDLKEVLKVTKPVPVTDRKVEVGPYEEEPTMRPAQPPALALATVLKSLEDELAHLKIELAQYQALYTKHDPALSKRRRKSVQRKIEDLVKAVDTKSDQIYALYDVLEGQKESGQEMSEAEVEVTLNNIGINVDELTNSQKREGEEQLNSEYSDSSSDEEDMNLPWEGIDETGETNKSGRSGASKRRSWA